MIKLENTDVMNMDNAIRGMRNPMNSWQKSDSYQSDFTNDGKGGFVLGENDLKLAQSLAHNGSDHRKFLRQIMVSVDITAPRYWWAEFDTYKVGTVANSCSTMHTIHKRDLTLDDFSHEKLIDHGDKRALCYLNDGYYSSTPKDVLENIIDALNIYRRSYIETGDKTYWYQMIQLLPSSYNQLRTVTLNYEVLLNQYHARNAHKLSEWLDYCEWIKTLPYAEELICSVG